MFGAGHRARYALLGLTVLTLTVGDVEARGARGNPHNGSGGGNSVAAPEAGFTRPDHDSALDARARGEIMPLEDILKRLGSTPDERLVDVVLEHRGAHWIYDITRLTPAGRYRILTVDASSGRLIQDQTK
jgi:hypothetical protein